MVDPVTPNKGYAIPTHGTDVDTWDQPINSDFGIIDNNFGGLLTLSLSNTPVTLSSSQAQNFIIRLTGALTGNVVITLPQVGSFYCIENLTTGAFYVQLTTGAGGAENIATPQGSRTMVFTDGTNVRFATQGDVFPGTMRWVYATALPLWMGGCTVSPWLIMDGTTFNATTYATLNTLLSGNTLPDFRGRTPFALDNQGSAGTAGRITNAGSGIVGTTIRAAGGAQSLSIGQANLPSFTLPNTLGVSILSYTNIGSKPNIVIGDSNSINQVPATGGFSNNVPFSTAQAAASSFAFSVSGSVTSGGSGTALAGMPPALIAGLFIIKT